MFLKILFNFLLGYKIVEIEGYFVEKFLNSSLKDNLFLWNLKRSSATVLRVNVADSDFGKLKNIVNKNQCLLKVISSRGIPNIYQRYKKRRYLIYASIVFIFFIFSISRFVWNIEVVGNSRLSKEDVISLVENDGLKIGKYKGKIDTEKIIKKIRSEREDISWIGIELKGTNAIVKIVETEEKPMVVDENDFCNIVAKKDGIISKISAQNGTIMVKDGDEVKQGQILIAGWMEGLYTGKYLVHSNGKVEAIIKYSQSEKIYKKETVRKRTERKENKFSIKVKNFQINLFKTLSKFEKYDTIDSVKNIQLSPNFYIPINFVKYTNFEVEESLVEHDFEDAKRVGEATAKQKLDDLIKGEIVDTKTEITEKDDYYVVTVYYDVIEEIGTKEKIVS